MQSLTVKKVYDWLDEKFPFKTAMDWDNVGLLVGDQNDKVNKILLALDVTNEVVEEAKSMGANLIITHHPVIFNPLKSISFNTVLCRLIKERINVISAHTNLDFAPGGVNESLAKAIGITKTEAFSHYTNLNGFVGSSGLCGLLQKEFDAKEFAEYLKQCLGLKGLRYSHLKNKKIRNVAVAAGGASSLVKEATGKGIDAFITGEIKHSDILFANSNGVCVFELGHFTSENVVIEPLLNLVKSKFENVEVVSSKKCTDFMEYM